MSRQFKETAPKGPWAGTPRRLLARRAIAFAAAVLLLAYLALDGAGYDIVVRQSVAFAVWILIAIGFALGFLPRSAPSRLLFVPLVAGIAMIAWMLLSFGWTASDERTMAELARVVGYTGCAVLALTALNRHTFRAAAAGLSVAALAIAAMAVASRLAPGSFPDATNVAAQFRTDRLDFPLDYWNAIGAWGAMSCAIGLAWSAHARTSLVRALGLAAVPVAGLAIYLSYSRGGAIGAIVAILAVLALSRNRWTAFVHVLAAGAGTALAIFVSRSNPEIAEATGGAGGAEVALALAAAGGICAGAVVLTSVMQADRARLSTTTARWAVPASLVVVLVGLVAAGAGGALSNAWDEFRNDDSPATGSDPAVRLTSAGGTRNAIWTSAIDAFEAEPITGLGPGTFEFWWLREGDDPEYVRDAHSLYLEFASEVGLPGLLLLLAVFGGLLAAALAARRTLESRGDIAASVAMCSAFVVFCANAGVDWMWEESAVAVLAIGGVAVAAAAGSGRLSRRGRRRPVWRSGARAGLVALAVVAAVVQVPGIASTQRLRASEDALRSGDVAGARTLAEQAIDAEPWAASAHGQLALVEREAGRLDVAEEEAVAAVRREPTSWEWPLVLAPIQAARGARRAAIRTFTAGRELGPHLYYYLPYSEVYGQSVFTNEQLKRKYARQQAQLQGGP